LPPFSPFTETKKEISESWLKAKCEILPKSIRNGLLRMTERTFLLTLKRISYNILKQEQRRYYVFHYSYALCIAVFQFNYY